MSWGISENASEKEKIKADVNDYLDGLNAVGIISYDLYSELYDKIMESLDKMYEEGRNSIKKEGFNMDKEIKYSCSEEEWQKHLKEEEENAKPYFEMLENEEKNSKLDTALEIYNELLDTWTDLEDYIYTEEYKQAFINFVSPRLENMNTYDEIRCLVIMTLHHETGDRRPYFKFDRN